MGHYFFSYLLACDVYVIEVLEIVAQMQQYIIILSLKSIKESSNFTLNYLVKSCSGRHHSEISNTKTMISAIWIRLQGSQGCQKMHQDPLNMLIEVCCAKIDLKLKNIQKSLRKQGFLTDFLLFMRFFEVCSIWTEY
jgi:hypothetical protein